MEEAETESVTSFICTSCGKNSKTGHFKWKLCHKCYLDKMRKIDEGAGNTRI